jgi:hypothetical protein
MRGAVRRGCAIAALGALAALGGCSPGEPWDDEFAQYGQRITTVSPSAGNTQAANEAIQKIDPWPRYAFNHHIPGNAAVAARAVHTYESGPQTSSGGSTTINISNGGGGSAPQ